MDNQERLELLEEEMNFPYMGISLEDAREIRYLLGNVSELNSGKIIQMSSSFVSNPKGDKEYIYVNGMSSNNKTFSGNIYLTKKGYNSYLRIVNEDTQESKVVETEFLYLAKVIQVTTKILDNIVEIKDIEYPVINKKSRI